jgi:hypothetical protein
LIELALKYKYKPKIEFFSKTNITKIAIVVIFIVAVVLIYASVYSTPPNQITTTTTTQDVAGCNNYYWFDDANRVCGYKKFCGLFMYMGLQTFDTLNECQAALATTTTTIIPTSSDTGELVVGMDVLRETVGEKIPAVGLATEFNLALGKVEVRDVSGNWFTIDDKNKSLDLVTFANKVAAVGKGMLSFGKYDQVMLHVSSASIKVYSTDFSIFNKTYDVYAPNNVINVTHQFIVAKDKTLALTLSVDIPQSVFKESATVENPTGYIFDPAISVTEEYVNLGSQPANYTVV